MGHEPVLLPARICTPKIDGPTLYESANDHDQFYNWLDKFLGWLRAHNVCGLSAGIACLDLVGQYLKGSASGWYASGVGNPDANQAPLSFANAVCAMHEWFVHTATAQQATLDYENCHWKPSDSVEGFYNNLLKFASCLVEYSTNYDI